MAPLSHRVARFLLLALVLTSAAVAVSAQDEVNTDDIEIDRTDFTEEHLKSDEELGATEAHGDIEPAWIFPESPDSKLPVGGTTDLLVALANGGARMFNVSHMEAQLLDAAGAALKLPRVEYGQPLGPHEQRSFRYPIFLDKEAALGEYTLVSQIYYNTRDKEPFVSLVCNETVELVPPLPTGDAQMLMLQAGLGVVGVLIVGLLAARAAMTSADSKAKPSKKGKGGSEDSAASAAAANEWLAGTLAATEGRTLKKTKKG